MDIFNLNLQPEENENNKFPKLDSWFDFMNDQFKKIEDVNNESKLNSLLSDLDINQIKN